MRAETVYIPPIDAQFAHLPPGRPPGPQTLRAAAGGGGIWWLVAVVGLAMLLSGAFVAAGGRGPEFDRAEELWGGLFFGAFGALALWVGYRAISAGRPQPPRRDLDGVTVEISPAEPRRGEQVQVVVRSAAPLEQAQVGLECIERFDHLVRAHTGAATSTVRQLREAAAHEEWRALEDPAAVATFRIPQQAPPSYEGQVVSYAWRVSLRAQRSRRRDARNDFPIWVRP